MDKIARKTRRRHHIRKRITGTPERPRLCIFKSNRNLNAQVVDDMSCKTLCSLSTLSAKVGDKLKGTSRANTKAAVALGDEIGKMAAAKGVKEVVFDRSGHQYHGVVKSFAEAVRKSGLKF